MEMGSISTISKLALNDSAGSACRSAIASISETSRSVAELMQSNSQNRISEITREAIGSRNIMGNFFAPPPSN